MIESGGADSVSIRAIADAVGVTPPSIYLHFPDKEALIVAVCERHFEVFDSVIEQAGATVDDPVESLRRRGRAYVRFGLDNPEPYRILFMSRTGGDRRLEAITDAGARAFQHLVDAVQRAIESGDFRPVDPTFAATAVWTAVHGVTSLLIADPRSGQRWLLDASPDLPEQVELARGISTSNFSAQAADVQSRTSSDQYR